MGRIKFRDQSTYEEGEQSFEYNSLEKIVEENATLSIREILERFGAGQMPNQSEALYSDDPDDLDQPSMLNMLNEGIYEQSERKALLKQNLADLEQQTQQAANQDGEGGTTTTTE